MKNICAIPIALLAGLGASAATPNSYTVTKLVTNKSAGGGKNVDPHLVNPWGLSRGSDTPWWAADEATGLSTLYNAAGKPLSTVVTISPAPGSRNSVGSPTGTAFFSNFVFVTLDGTIQSWLGPGSSTTNINVNNFSKGAVYAGCTVAGTGATSILYVANEAGSVEAYTDTFTPATLTGTFKDPDLPNRDVPYGIQTVGTSIYVAYFNPTSIASGAANGWVSKFDTEGDFKMHLSQPAAMNMPWGIAMAPKKGFGKFSNRLLVGMEGNGEIAAFDASTGKYLGLLEENGKPIVEPGLWAIYFGGGDGKTGIRNDGPKTTLYFAAGGGGYASGVFGSIVAK